MPTKHLLTLSLLASLSATLPGQAPLVLSVDSAHPGAAINPAMFGIFFEDINFAADGGLYPELVKNRSFEFQQPLTGWHETLGYSAKGLDPHHGELAIRTDAPLNESNPHYLRVRVYEPGYSFYNTGFRGMGIQAGAEYRFSVYARSSTVHGLRMTLTDEAGHEIGTGKLEGFGANPKSWQHYETIVKATTTSAHAQLNVFVDEPGRLDLDMVSLFPVDTWKQRPNGLRKDLVQLLYDMHPGFLRFPGGCIVEGRTLATRFQWKTTVGDVAKRKTIINRWNDEFDKRPAPDYFQSFGLGFYEYFQLAEDIGAQPLPILNCGMACQFNTNETASLEQLDEYIRDAQDLIDFANGPVTTPWGKLRSELGHPEPFHLTMIGVGNEQWGPHYVERYKVFAEALKASHPEIRLVVSAGPFPTGEPFDSMWTTWRSLHADIVDEHYYQSPEWFLQNSNRYDHYDRGGPKVFAGEYAAQTVQATSTENRNNWQAALSEAAFMTGLERNGDVVQMASYAPLMAHVDAWQWKPDEIWFDNLRAYGTPNYQVQKLYATNAGTRVVPITPALEAGIYASAVLDDRAHELVLKIVNTNQDARQVTVRTGLLTSAQIKVTTLAGALDAEDSFDHPDNIVPETSTIPANSGGISLQLKPNSVNVFRLPAQ